MQRPGGSVRGDNTRRIHQWLIELNAQASAKVAVVLARLEQGKTSALKSVGAGVAELRFDFGPAIQIDQDRIVQSYEAGTAIVALATVEQDAADRRNPPSSLVNGN